MPDGDGADEDGPEQDAGAELEGALEVGAGEEGDGEASGEEDRPGGEDDGGVKEGFFHAAVERVAQDVLGVTVVNAEAGEVAVFDQHPTDMAPEAVDQGGVRVVLLVGELVVAAVDGDPAGRGVLH